VSGRKARVEQALRDVLADLVAREVKDPRVARAGLISVTRVECNADLSVAHVYVSVYGDDQVAAKALAGLGAAAGFLRGPAGRRLNLARPPELRFHHDATPEVAMHLADIVREDEARARAAGRDLAAEAAEAAGAEAAGADTAEPAGAPGEPPGPEDEP